MQPIIKSSKVRVQERARRHPSASDHGSAHGTPGAPAAPAGKQARLVTVGGEVRAIEFRCDCGELTVLELEYEGATAASAAAHGTERAA